MPLPERNITLKDGSDANSGSRNSRQQPPVSCRFCRTRKLRCNREQPCSNCRSRGISCQIPGSRLSAPDALASATASASPAPTLENHLHSPAESRTSSDNEISQRLERLEKLVTAQSERWDQLVALTPQLNHGSLPSPHSLLNEGLPLPVPRSADLARQNSFGLNGATNHARWLESFDIGRERMRPKPSINFVFKIVSVRHPADGFRNLKMPAVIVPEDISSAPLHIWVPPRPEAEVLLQKYIDDVLCFHHVVHVPTLRAMFDKVYASLERPEQLHPGEIILMLGIFTSSTFYWNQQDCLTRGLYPTVAAASSQAINWLRVTQHLIEICNKLTCLSLEVLQGLITVSLVVANMETMALGFRHLLNMGLMMAREMRLHLTDYPGNAASTDRIRAEVNRRVWWYLAVSDWLLAARSIGAHEGVYQTSPRQMMVKWPLNVNDEDLTNDAEPVERSMSEPTTMSHSLQRLRLGEISRSIADRIPLITSTVGPSSYSDVLAADIELEKFLGEVPPFFRLRAMYPDLPPTNPSYPKSLAIQKYFLNMSFHSQRCKLNLPFLALGYTNQAYAHSRQVCLQAARMTVKTELELEEEVDLPFVEMRLRMSGLLNGLFIASSALFMDICIRNAPACQELRQGDAGHALRILEGAARQSDLAACLVRSMMQVLRKHSAVTSQCSTFGTQPDQRHPRTGPPCCPAPATLYQEPPPVQAKQAIDLVTSQPPPPPPPAGVSGMEGLAMEGNMDGQMGDGMDLTSFLGELAETFGSDPNVENFDWNKMLLELDSLFT